MNPEGYDGAKERNICDKDRGVTYKTVLTNAGGEKTERLSFPSVQPSAPREELYVTVPTVAGLMVLTLVFSPEHLSTIPTCPLFLLSFTGEFMGNSSCHSIPYFLAFVACSVG